MSSSGPTGQVDPQLEVTVTDIASNLADVSQLIDVRELEEWRESRIPGATLIPMSELAERVVEIDHAQPLVVYCRSGGRSLMVAEALQNAGYDAKSMAGGILEWERAGHAIER